MTYHVFKCGCEVEDDKIVKDSWEPVSCPEHGAPRIDKYIICPDCGERHHFKFGLPVRCSDCGRIHDNKLNGVRQKALITKRLKDHIHCKGTDKITCGRRVPVGRNNQKTLRCTECNGKLRKKYSRIKYRSNDFVNDFNTDEMDALYSLEEVGESMNISRERVRQLEINGMRKFRKRAMNNPVLKLFVQEINENLFDRIPEANVFRNKNVLNP